MKIQTLLYVGLCMFIHPFKQPSNIVASLPIEIMNNDNTIKYTIHVACECENYQMYVDGILIQPVSVVNDEDYLETEWNATKIFIPEIKNEIPKIIAFHATGGQFSGTSEAIVVII